MQKRCFKERFWSRVGGEGGLMPGLKGELKDPIPGLGNEGWGVREELDGLQRANCRTCVNEKAQLVSIKTA